MGRKLTFIDLFCGAGGLSLGLEQAGLEGVLAVDHDEDSIATYRRNFAHSAYVGSVEELLNDDGSLRLSKQPRIDIIAGGPPCQGFSVQRRGSNSDDRNELVAKFALVIARYKPRAFILENVVGIGSERGRLALSRFFQIVGEAGYTVTRETLRAFDFGVPQMRTRVFVVGFLNPKNAGAFCFPTPTTPSNGGTVREVIGDLVSVPLGSLANHQADRLSQVNLSRIRALKPGQTRVDLPDHLQLRCHRENPGHRHLDTYGRMAWDEPAPTITARFDSFSRGKFGHPEQDRTITLREGARLQGFPDSFIFEGKKVSVARQIGNAVPPPLAKAVGISVKEALI